MNASTIHAGFARRFDRLWRRMRRVLVGRAVCSTLLAATLGVALLAAADYRYELGWQTRAAGLGALGVCVLLLLGAGTVRVLRRWERPRTAAEVERAFPQLGQSVRTTVQYSGREEMSVRADGVVPSLVAALDEDTDLRSYPLGIGRIVPAGRLKAAAGATGVALLVLVAAAAWNREWRTATGRALLGEIPYTELAVSPGNFKVDQGATPAVTARLTGRTERDVQLHWRAAGSPDAEWQRRAIGADELKTSKPRLAEYEVLLDPVEEPVEYRIIAGPAQSRVHRIDVAYPLAIDRFAIKLEPPAYTGRETKTVEDGNLDVIAGTRADFQVTLSRRPATARVVFESASLDRDRDDSGRETVPLEPDGKTLSFARKLTGDMKYAIVAEDADGKQLPENSYHIHVREDRRPQVWFEEPPVALEVHALAEVPLRIRARDDFGLTKAGIVFEVNNEEEYQLLTKDFTKPEDDGETDGVAGVERSEPPARSFRGLPSVDPGHPPRTTATTLERVLPLEYFQLTQKDSVTYYAYVEDNHPDGPRRTETELRFIDIRPFKRRYRMLDPGMAAGGAGNELVSLDELIGRQRFSLNRTRSLARRAEREDDIDPRKVERLVEFETKLAGSARDLAQFLLDREIEGNDSIFRAEEFMLAAADSLAAGKYGTSVLQQKDALRYLIDGRNKVEIALSNQPASVIRQLRSFARMQAQKLRRPDSEDEEDPERIVERLEQLADDEEIVYETLAGILMDDMETEAGQNGSSAGSGKQERESETEDGSDEDAEKPDEPEGSSTSGEQQANASGTSESSETGEMEQDGTGGLTREEAAQKQTDVSLEAHDVERILTDSDALTELARERLTEAAETADAAAGALNRGDTDKAADEARQAAQMFDELALHVDALLTPEAARRIARARDLAGGLAHRQRRAAERMTQKPASGSSEEDGDQEERGRQGERESGRKENDAAGDSPPRPLSPSPSQSPSDSGGAPAGMPDGKIDDSMREFSRLAETGKTLQDVLTAIAESVDVEDQEAIWQVEALIRENRLEETVESMQNLSAMARQTEPAETRREARRVAERLAALAHKLAVIHRRIVNPRLQDLVELQERAARLQAELNELQAQAEIASWHRETGELLEDLEKQSVAGAAADKLRQTMREGGWGTTERWSWERGADGYYNVPVAYTDSVQTVIEEIERHMQELTLSERLAADEEPTPPEYKHLVDRYYEVLTSGTGDE